MAKGKKDVERKDKLAEWEAKGARWCAEQLWNARKRTEDLNRQNRRAIGSGLEDGIKVRSYGALKKANDTLKTILEESGIFPTKLTLYYRAEYCEKCGENPENGGDGEECQYCEPDLCVDVVKTVSFYAYKITDGEIEGITAAFEDGNAVYECYKIVNEKTGDVLYEAREEAADEKAPD